MALRSVCSTVVMISDPPGLPAASQGWPSLNTSVGVMEERGRLPGSDGVGLALHQAVGVGGAGFGGKVVHLVVEQHAGARHYDVRAEAEVEGVGVGDHIAVGIGYGVVGRVGALVGYRVTGADFIRGLGLIRGDQFAARSRRSLC